VAERQCEKKFAPANSFQTMIQLVKAAEAKLAATGIMTPQDQRAVRDVSGCQGPSA
jgi:hypothetical protein